MIIKKFQAKTENEAVENAKRELGQGVVIMNVRQVKKRGVLCFLRPQLTEVTVALEEESEKYPAARKETEEQAQKPDTAERRAANRAAQAMDQNILPEEEAEDKRDSSVIEEKLDSLHELLEQQLQKPEGEGEEFEEETSETVKFMKLLYNTMLDNEVGEKYANQIIDEIEKLNKPNMPLDYALAGVYQKMILKFGQPSCIQPSRRTPKTIFFVGPTGVGKTTTIAKIASRLKVEERKEIALLTADTYRIAAAEQLRTYANILEVPFQVIYTSEEMKQAIQEYRSYDFILVDTAGHSYKNEEQRENMSSFIHCVDDMVEKEVYLVLSATTKYRDLVVTADAYSQITDYKLIFTKLDETETLGNLLNLKLYTGAPMSYVTCGQNVPDDIEDFNPQKTVKKLLGGKK